MTALEGKRDRARRRTLLVLAFATAVGSAGLAAGGTAGALLGAEIAGTEAAAALLVSGTTGRAGRGTSLALGYVLGALGAVLVIGAAVAGGFAALLAGSAVLGAGNTSVFLARYAAAEVGGEAARGRALGTVLFAAALGAVASPNLLGPSGDLARGLGLPPLAGLYVVAILCFAAAALLLAAVSIPGVPYLGGGAVLVGAGGRPQAPGRGVVPGVGNARARAALGAANLVMVAVMAIAPVHLATHGHGLGVVGIVVGVHVAGMFAPSPVSGRLADKSAPSP